MAEHRTHVLHTGQVQHQILPITNTTKCKFKNQLIPILFSTTGEAFFRRSQFGRELWVLSPTPDSTRDLHSDFHQAKLWVFNMADLHQHPVCVKLHHSTHLKCTQGAQLLLRENASVKEVSLRMDHFYKWGFEEMLCFSLNHLMFKRQIMHQL